MISRLACIIFLIITTQFAFAKNTANNYWDKQRRGANVFNKEIPESIWKNASLAHIKFVRLAPDKRHSKSKDFLIGNADNYQGLVSADMTKLKQALDQANRNGIKVELTMLSLPGARWKQLNNSTDDSRLWKDEKYQQQAIHFWQDLATSLKNHPAIVGYNIINEPHPEILFGIQEISNISAKSYSKKVAGTAADLALFYQKVVDAIRKIDPSTPIILDVGMYADPRAFTYFKPIQGKNILYAFHMYEPYSYTNKKTNNGKYSYPGMISTGKDKTPEFISKKELEQIYFKPVVEWQKKYHIPNSQIVVEEFGGNRMAKGLDKYFSDLIAIFNTHHWHWAFYSFQEDTWDGMNYELGNKPLGEKYWNTISKGQKPVLKIVPNATWEILTKNLSIESR